jgi:hypothetical protein
MTNFEKNVYANIDNALHLLSKSNTGEPLPFNSRDSEGKEAISIIRQHNLISFRSTNINRSIVDITTTGHKVLEMGGINIYLNKLNDIEIRKQNKESLELDKLFSEVQILQRQLSDYTRNKIIAIAAFVISVCLSLLELYKLIANK